MSGLFFLGLLLLVAGFFTFFTGFFYFYDLDFSLSLSSAKKAFLISELNSDTIRLFMPFSSASSSSSLGYLLSDSESLSRFS